MHTVDDDTIDSSEIRVRTDTAMRTRQPIPIEYLEYIDVEKYDAEKEREADKDGN